MEDSSSPATHNLNGHPPPQQPQTPIALERNENEPAKSAQHDQPTNGNEQSHVKSEDTETNHNDERPIKRRKLADSLAPERSTSRPASPPWRKSGAEGPTTFFAEGKRKSARFNTLPLELQPQGDRRRTRAAVHQANNVKSGGGRTRASNSTQNGTTVRNNSTREVHTRKTSSSGTQTSKKPNATPKALLNTNRENAPVEPNKLKRRRSAASAPINAHSSPSQKRVGRPRRSSYIKRETVVQDSKLANGWHDTSDAASLDTSSADNDDLSSDPDELDLESFLPDPNQKPQRLRLKVNIAKPFVQHPSHMTPAKKYDSLREWLDAEGPVHEPPLTLVLSDQQVQREARTRDRLAKAAEPGGLLDPNCSRIDEPDEQEEPQRQYTRHDFMLAHTIRFQQLLEREHRKHVTNARKYAHDAQIKWKASQPKSAEEIQYEKGEERQATILATMKQCIRDLAAKWDIFKAEVNNWRLERWKEEQEALGKETLNRVLEESSKLLDSRFNDDSALATTDEEAQSDDGEVEGGTANESAEDLSEDMSEDDGGDEDDDVEMADNPDDELTAEELRRKYSMPKAQDPDRPLNAASRLSEFHDLQTETPISEFNDQDADVYMKGMDFEDEEIRTKIAQAQQETLDADGNLSDDESTDMDSESDSEEDDDDDESDSDADENEDEEEESGSFGLSALLGKPVAPNNSTVSRAANELKISKERSPPPAPQPHDLDNDDFEDEELEEVSLIIPSIPDAAQVQTPLSGNEAPPNTHHYEETQPDDKSSSLRNTSILELDQETPTLPTEPDNIEPSVSEHHNSMPATPISFDLEKKHIPSLEVPHLLRATLREYQKEGFNWLADRYKHDANGILADEMGLGKTIQTITLLAYLALKHEVWGPHLIIVPTSVILNWEMEFKKFLPGFKVLSYYGNPEERKQKRKGWLDDDQWNVVITSYHLVVSDVGSFNRRLWHYLILDEAHNIKNFRSQRWQTLLTFRSHSRLLLTGTPLQNNLEELWSLLFFLVGPHKAEEFLNRQEFSQLFKKPADQILEHEQQHLDKEAREQVQKLHHVLRPRLLRRKKADVEKQMPGKYEHVVYCRLSKRQRHLYDGFLSRSQTRETLAHGNYLSIINCLMQLRKVCNHPDLFETRPIVTSFAMKRSAVANFEIKELLIRRKLLQDEDNRVNLDVVDLLPGSNGPVSALDTMQPARLNALFRLRDLAYYQSSRLARGWPSDGQSTATNMYDLYRLAPDWPFDGSTVASTLGFAGDMSRAVVFENLKHLAYLTSLRSQRRPLYSHSLAEKLRIPLREHLASSSPPKRRVDLAAWWTQQSSVMQGLVKSLPQRAELMDNYVRKFACVTPAVVAPDSYEMALGRPVVETLRETQKQFPQDAFHEARVRLSIAFPDKRLLQFDCGKLQRLDSLLRTLQTGGHRALIFTQMTKVLDILEQFLNIHGHRYLRLDGSTKLEQRQILTERFNTDPSILVFILSSRSGGLGINLTGADTVIFYDLDWNPAMDKQCQDRCHRIGQTRDVHIYRFVSEHTIEANILRKSNQKRLLDDVIIQGGDFTTEYFNKPNPRDIFDDPALGDADAEASAAFDRVLGIGNGNNDPSAKIFEQAEDREDVAAARHAEKELNNVDHEDFADRGSSTAKSTRPTTPHANTVIPPAIPNGDHLSSTSLSKNQLVPTNVDEMPPGYQNGEVAPRTDMSSDIFKENQAIGVDRYIVEHLEWELKDVPFVAPEAKKSKKKKADEHRVRRKDR